MKLLEVLLVSIQYVQSGPYFWGSMGFIFASAMLIGALIFGGNHKFIFKFILGLLAYVVMLIFVNLTRASQAITSEFTLDQSAKAYASTITTIYVTFFWIAGLFLGLVLDKLKAQRLKHS